MGKASDCFDIYRTTISEYPLDYKFFVDILQLDSQNQNILIKYIGDTPVGACVYNKNGINLLMVKPDFQQQGIGTILIKEAEEYIKKHGGEKIILGNTGVYLWQGVPIFNEKSSLFFEKQGYTCEWVSIDMILDLKEFKSPEPKINMNCNFEISSINDKDELLNCVRAANPDWLEYFIDIGEDEVLIAKDSLKNIVGFTMFSYDEIRMKSLLKGRTGSLACLGVPPKYRSKGIGLRLAYEGTVLLKKALCDYSFLGYTWLEDWYGKLGYKKYMSFWMGSKKL